MSEVLVPTSPGKLAAALSHVTTHWQTSLVGVALLGLGVASYFGVQLPVVGGVALTPDQLLVAGLSALGFLVSKDSNK